MIDFMTPIQVSNDHLIQIMIIDYSLELNSIIDGVWYFKRTPLPIGSLKLVFDTSIWCRLFVIDKIASVLHLAIGNPINGSRLAQIESSIRAIINSAIETRDLLPYHENMERIGYVIHAETEYFKKNNFIKLTGE